MSGAIEFSFLICRIVRSYWIFIFDMQNCQELLNFHFWYAEFSGAIEFSILICRIVRSYWIFIFDMQNRQKLMNFQFWYAELSGTIEFFQLWYTELSGAIEFSILICRIVRSYWIFNFDMQNCQELLNFHFWYAELSGAIEFSFLICRIVRSYWISFLICRIVRSYWIFIFDMQNCQELLNFQFWYSDSAYPNWKFNSSWQNWGIKVIDIQMDILVYSNTVKYIMFPPPSPSETSLRQAVLIKVHKAFCWSWRILA